MYTFPKINKAPVDLKLDGIWVMVFSTNIDKCEIREVQYYQRMCISPDMSVLPVDAIDWAILEVAISNG
jgi:hypothetical protein